MTSSVKSTWGVVIRSGVWGGRQREEHLDDRVGVRVRVRVRVGGSVESTKSSGASIRLAR